MQSGETETREKIYDSKGRLIIWQDEFKGDSLNTRTRTRTNPSDLTRTRMAPLGIESILFPSGEEVISLIKTTNLPRIIITFFYQVTRSFNSTIIILILIL